MTIHLDCLRTREALLAGAGCPCRTIMTAVSHSIERQLINRKFQSARHGPMLGFARNYVSRSGSIIVGVLSADRFIKSAQARVFVLSSWDPAGKISFRE